MLFISQKRLPFNEILFEYLHLKGISVKNHDFQITYSIERL